MSSAEMVFFSSCSEQEALMYFTSDAALSVACAGTLCFVMLSDIML